MPVPVDIRGFSSTSPASPGLSRFLNYPVPLHWAIAPALVAVPLSKKLGLTMRRLDSGPADEIIYYLLGPRRKEELTGIFLACLDRELKNRPEIESLLPAGSQRTEVI